MALLLVRWLTRCKRHDWCSCPEKFNDFAPCAARDPHAARDVDRDAG